ncbi:conserved protein of unknown function [Nitrospira japonica]|uniref:DUF3800 domain-containing protein n=2 Tax=Nitrospira japonica TaxID=1325564 RepID=A0A1W1I1Q9_9BACT|nr:conserved protein of unknown function [Nitrospira japonica]
MDCFGLGGFLLKEEDIPSLKTAHERFCNSWNINYPLHSSSIRGKRGRFSWLRSMERADQFLSELEHLLVSLPGIAIACVIHRPGYVSRYREMYPGQLWFMCKTAFSILVERSAKFSDGQGRKLEIVFEGTGKKEDRNLKHYLKELKRNGSPFSTQTSHGYTPLVADDFRRIILGELHQKTKEVPMLQLADLLLYPMAKAGYEPSYGPFVRLKEAGRLIDCYFTAEECSSRGIKYSCFERS